LHQNNFQLVVLAGSDSWGYIDKEVELLLLFWVVFLVVFDDSKVILFFWLIGSVVGIPVDHFHAHLGIDLLQFQKHHNIIHFH
jgi:hypothetical protein